MRSLFAELSDDEGSVSETEYQTSAKAKGSRAESESGDELKVESDAEGDEGQAGDEYVNDSDGLLAFKLKNSQICC